MKSLLGSPAAEARAEITSWRQVGAEFWKFVTQQLNADRSKSQTGEGEGIITGFVCAYGTMKDELTLPGSTSGVSEFVDFRRGEYVPRCAESPRCQVATTVFPPNLLHPLFSPAASALS